MTPRPRRWLSAPAAVLLCTLCLTSLLAAEDPGGGAWTTIFHGYAFLNSNRQSGPVAQREFESQNHFMVISSRGWGGGKLSLLGTFTLEPATVPDAGAPELFQRGETFNDVLLVDRQHPHDLIAQLAAAWENSISAASSFRLYIAPRGEPALGPDAYPHRLSSSMNPTAPLAHHNQDSTHISADVITGGVTLSRFRMEGSVFHGRESDQNRWDLEQGRLDSYSGRVTFHTPKSFSFQISSAFRTHPEDLEEGDQTRTTASATYNRTFKGGFIAATAIVGKNQIPDGKEWGNSIEALWKLREKHYLTARFESVDRDLVELITKQHRPAGVPAQRTLVQAMTLGYARAVPLLKEAETDLGIDLTAYRFTSQLDAIYGENPVSLHVFLKIAFAWPAAMDHEHMHH